MSWILWIIVGLLAGWIAQRVMDRKGGLIKNLVVGLIGAFVGGLLANAVGLEFYGFLGTLIVATVGAVVVLWLFALLAGR
ncbi:MAG: transglycosylase [Rhizobiaceae bacterium MnEN-MB40S]|nr:MAG: transglycosylase [Rhizobiaceae bacterium MnEN-MB40S]